MYKGEERIMIIQYLLVIYFINISKFKLVLYII